jgi:Mrp family chromosome partitioning ATPase
VLRRIDLESALVPVSLTPGEAGRGVGTSESPLRVLTLGSARPPAPGEFVGSAQVQAVIKGLEEMADFVIIDGPPLLVVSDAVTVAQHVDAMIVIARIDRISRSVARETRRVLSRMSTPLLGIVTTGPRQTMGTPSYLYDASMDGAAAKPFARTPPLS